MFKHHYIYVKRILLIPFIFLYACNKSPTCETWDISHECRSTNPNAVGCDGSISYLTVKLCDKDLEQAKSGKDKITDMGAGVQQVTHYIKRVQ